MGLLPPGAKKAEPEEEPQDLPRFPEPPEMWRREQYLRMGFEQTNAFMLAADPNIDWHRIGRLLKRGWTHQQILRTFL